MGGAQVFAGARARLGRVLPCPGDKTRTHGAHQNACTGRIYVPPAVSFSGTAKILLIPGRAVTHALCAMRAPLTFTAT